MLNTSPTRPELRKLLTELSTTQPTLAANTYVSYGYDWKRFMAWCTQAGRGPLPADPETMKMFIIDMLCTGKKVTTTQRHVASITFYHRQAGLSSPLTHEINVLLAGAKRMLAEQPRQMEALTLDQIRAMAEALVRESGLRSLRDRALVLLGFASALRSASLCLLQVADLKITEPGIRIYVRKEKQDRTGKGRYIGVPRGQHVATCPVTCVEAWLVKRGTADGPLFIRLDAGARGKNWPLRAPRVRCIVKACMRRAGLSADGFGSHSMRAGFVTAAGEAGASMLLIADTTGHSTMEVLRDYFRRRQLFRANAAAMLGL